jgi:hypothetical protein
LWQTLSRLRPQCILSCSGCCVPNRQDSGALPDSDLQVASTLRGRQASLNHAYPFARRHYSVIRLLRRFPLLMCYLKSNSVANRVTGRPRFGSSRLRGTVDRFAASRVSSPSTCASCCPTGTHRQCSRWPSVVDWRSKFTRRQRDILLSTGPKIRPGFPGTLTWKWFVEGNWRVTRLSNISNWIHSGFGRSAAEHC